ncbi:hypothetical protein EGW08_009724 [Elysia chlorotica]|uniref:SMB domain-containing protein n=1 Tax=Elysia chlorotica TaxID=188477 RepID=A0A3S0ZMI7_ELYCH|nr:hypothetical protein EGW08_009724 [Elysia chlorotica]
MGQRNRITRFRREQTRPRFGTMDDSTDSPCKQLKPRCRFLLLRLLLLPLLFISPAHHTRRSSALVVNALFLTRWPVTPIRPVQNLTTVGFNDYLSHTADHNGDFETITKKPPIPPTGVSVTEKSRPTHTTSHKGHSETVSEELSFTPTENPTDVSAVTGGVQSSNHRRYLETITKGLTVGSAKNMANESLKEDGIYTAQHQSDLETTAKELTITPAENVTNESLTKGGSPEHRYNSETINIVFFSRPKQNMAVESLKEDVTHNKDDIGDKNATTKELSSSNGSLEVQNWSQLQPTLFSRKNHTVVDFVSQGVNTSPSTPGQIAPKNNVTIVEGEGERLEKNVNVLPKQLSHIDFTAVLFRDKNVVTGSNFTTARTEIMNQLIVMTSTVSDTLKTSSSIETSNSIDASINIDKINRNSQFEASPNDTASDVDEKQAHFITVTTPTSPIEHTMADAPSFVPPSNVTEVNTVYLLLSSTKRQTNISNDRTDAHFKSEDINGNNDHDDYSDNNRRPSPINISERSYVHNKNWHTANSSNRSLSCRYRCGYEANFPCSCDDKCVVHRTCCEDLAQVCPELYSQAVAKFEHLLNASVRCDRITAVFMVESCPSGLKTNGEVFPRTPSSVSPGETPESGDGEKTLSLLEVMSNAPVTDLETGIIYANARVYDCNKRGVDSNFSETLGSPMAVWYTKMATLSKQAPRRIQDINKELDVSTFSYSPPLAKPVMEAVRSLCYNDETVACIAKLANQTGIQDLICNKTVPAYYTLRNFYIQFPISELNAISDKICAACLSDYQKGEGLRDRFLPVGYNVLLSVSESRDQVVYDLPLDLQIQPNGPPWWSWTCNISAEADTQPVTQLVTQPVTQLVTQPLTQAMTQLVTQPVTQLVTQPLTQAMTQLVTQPVTQLVTQLVTQPVTQTMTQPDMPCRVLQCHSTYLKIKEDTCGRMVEAEFSIQSEMSIKGKTCRISPEVFATALKCFLYSMFTLKPMNYSPRYDQVYLPRADLNLTTVRMHMYFDSQNRHYTELISRYFTFYSAMLIFAQQHCVSSEEGVEWGKFTPQSLVRLLSKQIPSGGSLKVINLGGRLSIDMENPQVQDILDSFIFRVCIQVEWLDKNLHDEIKCDQSSEFRTGSATVKLDDVVAELHGLGCFNKPYSGAANQATGASCLVLYLSVVVVLLTK